MTGEDEELIDGQYADRPGLRPILDAVLGVLPELGDVTVQARKTIVSLVSPRRTFGVVQATTKSRVDLGVRLDEQEPGGRLLAARNLGSANLRIGLTSPADLDDEAIEWLRRAYAESVAPPRPRRKPATRPKRDKIPVPVVIEGFELPGRSCHPEDGAGHDNVHVALRSDVKQRPGLTVPNVPWQAAEAVPGDAASARWELEINLLRGDDDFDFGGPFVRGDRTDRHLGLVWGDVRKDGTFVLFRGAKLRLVDIDPALLEKVAQPDRVLLARVRLTDQKGNPMCARVRPPDIAWSVEQRG